MEGPQSAVLIGVLLPVGGDAADGTQAPVSDAFTPSHR